MKDSIKAQLVMRFPLASTFSRIETLAEVEKTTKAEVSTLAHEALCQIVEHGNNGIANRLLLAVTPANRTALALLFKEVTAFPYDAKTKQLKNKGTVTPEKEAKLEAFVEKYNCDLWAWYESTKEDKILSVKFDENKLISALSAFFAEKAINGVEVSDDEVGNMMTAAIAKGKAAAAKLVATQNRVAELVAIGIDAKVAKKQAEIDFDNGKLTA